MDALRRYLSHYCRCDDKTVARYVAAEEIGKPLRLPDLAYAVTLDWRLLQAAVVTGEAIVQERAERATAAEAAAKAKSVSTPPQKARVLVANPAWEYADAMRRSSIIRAGGVSHAKLAQKLAADPSITVVAALTKFQTAQPEASVDTSPYEAAPNSTGAGGANVAFHSNLDHYSPPSEREQYEAAMKEHFARQGPATVRIYG